MKHNNYEALQGEARHLHYCMFHYYPSAEFLNTYVRAHLEIHDLNVFDARQIKSVKTIVDRNLDAVGIEPWLRSKGRRHALCSKVLLIAYLAECDASHREFKRNAAQGKMAFIHMALVVAIAFFRLVHGLLQKLRYGLV